MASTLSKAESWETIYEAYKFINFTSFDYASVKQALIDYTRLYHPEFNNWIETDEYVKVIEAFAYISELYSYRLDMVANENLMDTAQRKESILKLAKFISYKPSRIVPGSGLVKIVSINTSEHVQDLNGNDLSNVIVYWNDPNNPNWKSQFFIVVNSIIRESFGNVLPSDRIQVFDQIYELYTVNNIPLDKCVIPYQINAQNKSIAMELVSADLTDGGPIEQRPDKTNLSGITSVDQYLGKQFNILYATDGLGDSSDYTGFFILTKQGTIKRESLSFDGVSPHLSQAITTNNINDSDVWLNEITGTTSVYWEQVETVNAQNVIFNDVPDKNKYEVESLADDQIKLIFGDGDSTNIPSGLFDVWYRVSDPSPVVIPSNAISNITSNLTYIDSLGNVQSLGFAFSAVQPIQNAAPSEDKEHIRINAPAVYYTQNRMVNGRDYNSYLLQNHTILKLKSINRIYSGQSKYTGFSDPSDTYQTINHLGSDLSVYQEADNVSISASNKLAGLTLLENYIQPLLSNQDNIFYRAFNNISLRRYFTDSHTGEKHNIVFNYMGETYDLQDMNPNPPIIPFAIYYENTNFVPKKPSGDDWIFYIDMVDNKWVVKYKVLNVVAHSPTTKFWDQNISKDSLTVLQANISGNAVLDNASFLKNDIKFNVSKPFIYKDPVQYVGQTDFNSLVLAIADNNQDGQPDVTDASQLWYNKIVILAENDFDKTFRDKLNYRLFDRVFDMPFDSLPVETPTLTLSEDIITSDVNISGDVDNIIEWKERDVKKLLFTNKLTLSNMGKNTKITITIPEYVYFYRKDKNTPFDIVDGSYKKLWYAEHMLDTIGVTTTSHYDRRPGRSKLNYIWHHAPNSDTKINPTSTNIIDCFVITRGYYQSTLNWLNGIAPNRPAAPLPHELRATYQELLNNKMISDEVVIRSGSLKVLFGKHAAPELRAKFLVSKPSNMLYTDNQIKSNIVVAIKSFFHINDWNFGDMFNFTELATYVHNSLGNNINSIVIKPISEYHQFGNLFQIFAMEHEIFVPSIDLMDIEIVQYLAQDQL